MDFLIQWAGWLLVPLTMVVANLRGRRAARNQEGRPNYKCPCGHGAQDHERQRSTDSTGVTKISIGKCRARIGLDRIQTCNCLQYIGDVPPVASVIDL